MKLLVRKKFCFKLLERGISSIEDRKSVFFFTSILVFFFYYIYNRIEEVPRTQLVAKDFGRIF